MTKTVWLTVAAVLLAHQIYLVDGAGLKRIHGEPAEWENEADPTHHLLGDFPLDGPVQDEGAPQSPSASENPSGGDPDDDEYDNGPEIEDDERVYKNPRNSPSAICPRDEAHANFMGQKCLRKCSSDDDCKSKKKKCRCDGACGMSCIKPERECEVLKSIEDGSISMTGRLFGSVATYSCVPGYHLVGVRERTCQADGQWSGKAPICKHNSFYCRNPPQIEHARHNAPPAQSTFDINTDILYQCHTGYVTTGFTNAKCYAIDGTASWFGPDISCEPRTCAQPADPANGWHSANCYSYTCHAFYTCADGYELVGRAERVCQSDGTWAPKDLPTCVPVQCPEPEKPAHGRAIFTALSYNSIVSYECDYGYSLVGEKSRRCGADKHWSGTKPQCREIDCGEPEPLYNGWLEKSDQSTGLGASIIFRCHEGMQLEGSTSTVCQTNSTWRYPTPKCLAPCVVPLVINGTLEAVGPYKAPITVDPTEAPDENTTTTTPIPTVATSRAPPPHTVPHGDQLIVHCEPQYEFLNNETPVVCNNGSWSVTPTCEPARCKQPPKSPRNGLVIAPKTDHGMKARFACRDGFQMQGNSIVECRYGKWVGDPPICEEVFCPFPGYVENGKVMLVGNMGLYDYRPYVRKVMNNKQIMYDCDKGYVLANGPPGATCVGGVWSPKQLPKCVPGKHPRLRWTRSIRRRKRSSILAPEVSSQWNLIPIPSDEFDLLGTPIGEILDGSDESEENDVSPRRIHPGFKILDIVEKPVRHGRDVRGAPLDRSNNSHESDESSSSSSSESSEEDLHSSEEFEPPQSLNVTSSEKVVRSSVTPASKILRGNRFRTAHGTANESSEEDLNSSEEIEPPQSLNVTSKGEVILSRVTRASKTRVGPQVLRANRQRSDRRKATKHRKDHVRKPSTGKAGPCEELAVESYMHVTVVKPGKDANDTASSNSEVLVTCDEGYHLNMEPNTTARCFKGRWKPVRPHCSIVPCVIPGTSHAIYRRANDSKQLFNITDPEEVVTFSCEPGFSPVGPQTLRCLHGDWNVTKLPVCVPGDDVPDDSSYVNGDLLISGISRGDLRGCAAPARVQGSLVYINGHVMREGEARASFPDESEVTFNCMSSIMGERSTWRIICRDGSWVGESNNCDAKAFPEGSGYRDNNTCTYRNAEPNVVSFYNDTLIKEDFVKFPEGSEVVSRCRDIGKFALIGSSHRKCINGDWDGQKPVCFGLNQQNDYALEKPPTILFRHSAGPIAQSNDGKLIVYPGTVLHMECLWIRRFGPPKWTVSHNFRVYPTGWSTEEGRDSTLEYRLSILHASKDDSGTFSCTTPTRHTHSIEIEVKAVHCPELPQKRGITYSTTSTKMNTRVTISCANGNSLIGATELVCLPSGNWSTNLPVCESVECADISNNSTTNLRVSILSREVGGQAVFSCPSGYGLRGNANTMCQPTGEWAGPFPTCEEVHCEAPGIPENGMIQGTAPYKAGDVVQFSCNQQYMLEGQPIIACQENGRWSGSVPKCVLACTYPGTVFHGHISAVRFYYKIGENITFECDEGLVIKGASMLRCQRSGQWSNALPVCVKSSELDANDDLDDSEGDDTEKHER